MMNLKKKIAGLLTLTAFVGLLAGTSTAGSPAPTPATVSNYAASGSHVDATSRGTVDAFPAVFLAGVVVGVLLAESAEDAQAGGCATRCIIQGASSEKILDM